ncbi:MAG: adenylyltransferase/cytidyltransferase family protein [Candidatus Paceibacterota bacterium]
MKRIFDNVNEIKKSLPSGKSFTLVGGSFDLFHVGHIHVLEYASTLEDILVVAVLSDDFVRNI